MFWGRDGGAGVTKVLAHITVAFSPTWQWSQDQGYNCGCWKQGGLLSKKLLTTVKAFMPEFLRA